MTTAVPGAPLAERGLLETRRSPGPAVSADSFRSVMRHHVKGVAIITAGTDMPVGFCATSLCSVALEPLLVSFTVGVRSASWPTVRTATHIMVHLLAEGQEELARRFARPGHAKFDPPTAWYRGQHGLPVLDTALAWLLLCPVNTMMVSDHALIFGQVVDVRDSGCGRPLVHHNGQFGQLA